MSDQGSSKTETSETSSPGAEGGDTYVLDAQVGHLLRRAHQRATSLFMEGIGASQLTPMQFAALVRLHQMGDLSQNHLGRLTAMDPATIQGVIRRLADRGLIERQPDTNDRRRMVLSLSDKGRALVEGLYPQGRAISADILSPLTPEEQTQFLSLLQRLV